MNLEGYRALITGGSRGLGQAICRVFSEDGARVAFSFSRDEEGAEKTLSEIRTKGHDFGLCFKTSVLDTQKTQEMVETIEETWGGIDVLVNNAGITQALPFALVEEEDWDRVMDINVKGTFITTKAVLRSMMRAKSGTILNIGSLAGMRAFDAPIHYSTSKAAIVGFTRSLSKQVARYGIRVNCLAPGLLEDGVGLNVPEHRVADYMKHCAAGRAGTLEEAARFASFLVSSHCSYVNGEVVTMDGGL